MQNAADNAALSIAVMRARILNLMGVTNYIKGTVLASGSFPKVIHFYTFNQQNVGNQLDSNCTGGEACVGETKFNSILTMRFFLNQLTNFQNTLMNPAVQKGLFFYVLERVSKYQNINSYNQPTGADGAVIIPESYRETGSVFNDLSMLASTFLYKIEGLKQNNNKVTYMKTVNTSGPSLTGEHVHVVWYEKYGEPEAHSWYYISDITQFSKSRITVLAIKRGLSRLNIGYPIFARWFGISWPDIYAVGSAASYCSQGPMFPTEQNDLTGVPWFMIPMIELGYVKSLKNSFDVISDNAALLPDLGPLLWAAIKGGEVAFFAYLNERIREAKSLHETPIKTYEEATRDGKGGWQAHLVPVKRFAIQH
jgi:hypothetical protein